MYIKSGAFILLTELQREIERGSKREISLLNTVEKLTKENEELYAKIEAMELQAQADMARAEWEEAQEHNY